MILRFLMEALWKNFSIKTDVFISKKKKHVHIAFKKSFSDYKSFDNILKFITDEWEKRNIFFEDY